ncbi:MAG: hypothetical protein NTY01_25380, partial [Verrucomicrobia bacterium]|nr:hypothetical protein [Verrucomicrobiota bacterium]
MYSSLKSAVVLFLAAATAAFADGKSGMIDDCRYADDAAAQKAWRPMGGTAPAAAATLNGRKALRLPCNFAGTTIERASWDRKVKLDLVPCQGIQFKVFCKNPAPISHFSVYFQSGGGWYSTGFFPEAAGWNTIAINKVSTRSEGTPAGWGNIETIRISAWRGRNEDTELLLSDLRMTGVLGVDASIAVVRGESLARSRSDESKSADQFAETVTQNLTALGVGCSMISDLDLTAERLAKAKLVILPHNPAMPDSATDALIKFLGSGGKLLAFYGLPAKLRSVVKIENGAHIKAKHPGYFSTIRFAAGALSGAPELVGQRSWNITEAKPVA